MKITEPPPIMETKPRNILLKPSPEASLHAMAENCAAGLMLVLVFLSGISRVKVESIVESTCDGIGSSVAKALSYKVLWPCAQ